MKHPRAMAIMLSAFAQLGTVTCSNGSSTDDGSGGQPNGGSASGGTSGRNTCEPAGTLTVTNQGTSAYVIDGVSNPDLTLCRKSVYTFDINAPGHPFYINTLQGTGTANAYNDGVSGNGATTDTVTFSVPTGAPDTLFYNCSIHESMTGTLHIVD